MGDMFSCVVRREGNARAQGAEPPLDHARAAASRGRGAECLGERSNPWQR